MEKLRQDLSLAFRRLLNAPLFTAVAVGTLALGIGANTAIFSIVNGVVLQPLPFPEPDRLVSIEMTYKGGRLPWLSPMNFLDIQKAAEGFDSMSAIDAGPVTLTERGAPAAIRAAGVSSTFFDVLRTPPASGRAFVSGENEPARSLVAVIGHGLWQSRFGADPSAIGQTIRLDGEAHMIVGIAAEGFSYPEGVEVWTPLRHDESFVARSRGAWYLQAIGRLKPGSSVPTASAEVSTIMSRLASQYPAMNEGLGGAAAPLHETIVGRTRPALYMLMGAVALVLLIACVNVANLVFARLASREPELAVRNALGAGQGVLFRQLMTESLLLAAVGGACGVALAWLAREALLGLRPADIPRMGAVRIDAAVLGFSALATLVTGLLFGTLPALRSRRPAAQTLREGARGLAGGGNRLRSGLVVGQMALAMMLLAGAGLLIRSFARLRSVEPGFVVGEALTFRISLPNAAYPTEAKRVAFYEQALRGLRALPGVESVAAINGLPLNRTNYSLSFSIRNRPEADPSRQPSMQTRVATAGYFETMGMKVVRGRGIEAADTATSRQVVVITESAASRFFAGEEPIGQAITIGSGREPGLPRPGGEIVGIVADVKDAGLAQSVVPEVFVPYPQLAYSSLDFVMRTKVPPLTLASAAEAVIHGLDRELPLARVRPLADIVASSIALPRFYMTLLSLFAGVAVALASLGIFGVISYSVLQRSREIGIRLALGARPGAVRAMVLKQALALAAGGIGLGLVGAVALSGTLRELLFHLSPTDPATLAGVAAALGTVAFMASWLPARQATRVDPIVTLRAE